MCSGPEATNNVGEWGAVRSGLRHLQKEGWVGVLEIVGDSQLVIYQLTGRYKCRKDTLIPFHDECKMFLGTIEWSARWVPREENEECDRLSKVDDGRKPADQPGNDRKIRKSNAGRSVGVPARRLPRQTGSGSKVGGKPAFGEETPEVSFD